MTLSIITINYNNRDGLRKTIESVIAQSCKDFEFIIIDGASTDGGVDVLKEYDRHIDYWSSTPDNGVYNAMNKGVKIARGRYCIFMNSGDTFHDEDVIKNAIGQLQEDGADVVTGGTWLSIGRLVPAPRSFVVNCCLSFHTMKVCVMLLIGSSGYRRSSTIIALIVTSKPRFPIMTGTA